MCFSPRSTFAALLLAVPALLLSGCGMGTPNTAALSSADISGSLYGGQSPVNQAHVYLFAASTAGYGSASTSLLTTGDGTDTLGTYVLTNARGGFHLTGTYSCTAGQQVYLLASGGDTGGGINTASTELAVLGTCPGSSFSSSLFIQVNELTTVAAAYALSGYITDITHVAASNSTAAATGMANAFNNAASLVTLGTGITLSTTPGGNGTVPTAEINTLGNIMASCVNSTGPTGSTNTPNSCDTLFAAATPSGGSAPTTTADAMINIAHNPGQNVTTLFNLQAPQAIFAPTLNTKPNDWTVGITYGGGHLVAPNTLAINSVGAVYITDSTSGLIVLSPQGAETYVTAGDCTTNATTMAVDTSDNVWVAAPSTNCLAEYSGNAGELTVAGGITAGLSTPQSLALDTYGFLWVANAGNNSIVRFAYNGNPSSTPITMNLNQPSFLAADTYGQMWVYNAGDLTASRFSTANSSYLGNASRNGISDVTGISIDGLGDLWLANGDSTAPSFSKFTSSGTILADYAATCATLPTGLAFDGANTLWSANGTGTSRVCQISSTTGATIAPTTGYVSAGMNHPKQLALDSAGNVWMLNGSANTVVELIGASSPVVTPLVATVINNTIATKP